MINSNSKQPLEEMQKHLQELFKTSGISVGLKKDMERNGLEEEIHASSAVSDEKQDNLKRIRNFNMKPKEVFDYLDKFVIQQNEAKKVLSVAICDHYNHIRQCIEHPGLANQEYSKPNILIVGPTGVGKTYLMKTIAKLIGVPFVKADATKFSETGYIGSDVDDMIHDLVKTSDGDVELAKYGIIYIDEIDKIASCATKQGRDISGRGVQINLLKLMEDTEVNLSGNSDMMSQMQNILDVSRGKKKVESKVLNTKHILFIASGAFDQLAETVKGRLHSSKIGFSNKYKTKQIQLSRYLKFVKTIDFIKYGFEPEFIGRLPVRVTCDSLTTSDLAEILTTSEGSILKQYIKDFRGYRIRLNILPETIIKIAQRAASERTGARGLLTILEKILREFKFELPSTSIEVLEISCLTIKCPNNFLKKILIQYHSSKNIILCDNFEVSSFCYFRQFDAVLNLDRLSVEFLINNNYDSNRKINAIYHHRFFLEINKANFLMNKTAIILSGIQ